MEKHQKRIAAPRSRRIERKTAYWTVKPRPGPHPGDRSVPLLLLVRDVLKLADNSREAKRVLNEGNIVVNGRVRKDHKFPVGVFDVLSIPVLKTNYIALLDEKGKLSLVKMTKEEASRKLCRVNDKRMLKEGTIQLNLHDGRNILPGEKLGEQIKTHDSLLISLPDNKILQHFAYKEG
ncbi:MAG: 30S ribosomal protein S4e, partial [Methanophagales archaeon]|nr:30S ribosomal protein S4e [Methanophagales archaeon]